MFDLRRCPADLAGLAARRSGVISLADCRAAGLTERRVRWLVASGRWQMPFPRTFVTYSGPLDSASCAEAALAYAGDGAALADESAGAYWGLCAQPDELHVVVAYPDDARDQPGLRIHRSRTFSAGDVLPNARPTRLRIEPTVLQLLRSKRSVEGALALVADAVRGRRTTAAQLRQWVDARPKTRWRKQVLMALPDLAAGAHSLLELKDVALSRRHGLPVGSRQFRRLRDGTEFLDHVIEEYAVHVELDGRLGHDRAREVWRDMKRDNASVVRRMRHLRYGWADVVGRPCEVAIERAVVLRQQGWCGAFRRCRSCPDPLPPGL
jgi:hypothetical protein